MKKFFLFLAAAFILASCTLSEKVVFNSNFGGEMSYDLDGTQYAEMMKSLDSTGQGYSFGDSLTEYKALADGIRNIQGISNVRYIADSTNIKVTFAFENIDALNRAHKVLNGDSEALKNDSKYEKATKKKSELIYRTWPLASSAKDTSTASMAMMLTYNLDASFATPVKSVGPSKVKATSNGFSWSSSAEDMGNELSFDGIKVKLGK